MSDTFTCDACGETFPKERSDEEAIAESKLLWPGHDPNELSTVCDDCFRIGFAIMPAKFSGGQPIN
jgi:hypothetical protein